MYNGQQHPQNGTPVFPLMTLDDNQLENGRHTTPDLSTMWKRFVQQVMLVINEYRFIRSHTYTC